jgi:acetoin utilization deacetylase AcuC-like enzyme
MSANAIVWISHPDFDHHDPGAGHPECPARLSAISDRLLAGGLDAVLHHRLAPMVDEIGLERVHTEAHIGRVLSLADSTARVWLDPDTVASGPSVSAALRAAGAGVDAVNCALAGGVGLAFCAVRPPGHHAEAGRAMGFCLFNNIAIAAAHALASGLSRVAVVDFDVHYGNGTARIFAGREDVLMLSSYQEDAYPNWVGDPSALNLIDVPLAAGSDGVVMRAAVEAAFTPALDAFRPEMILISAGFDAHAMDPLAGLRWTEADYAWWGEYLRGIAARHCPGRVVAALEGGYDTGALGRSVDAFVRAFVT